MKILVSKCLLGINCKYSGGNNKNDKLIEFLQNHQIYTCCPECDGGLTTPRDPSEVRGGRVYSNKGVDVTDYFYRGAQIALKTCQDYGIKVAILKSKSPSCGNGLIYDGTFSNNLTLGDGITAKLLKENNIKVLDENNYKDYF